MRTLSELIGDGFWIQVGLLILTFGVLSTVIYVEALEIQTKYEQCQTTYRTHELFAMRPICTNDLHREDFEKEGLLKCSQARYHVQHVRPHICALRAWFRESWCGRTWALFWDQLHSVWMNATGTVGSYLIIPGMIIITFWIYKVQEGKTHRAALKSEEVSIWTGVLEKMARKASENQAAFARSSPNSHYLPSTSSSRPFDSVSPVTPSSAYQKSPVEDSESDE